MRIFVKTVLSILAVVIAVILVLDGLYFLNGSLETHPTVEKTDGVRLVTGLIFVTLAIPEGILLWLIFRKTKNYDISKK